MISKEVKLKQFSDTEKLEWIKNQIFNEKKPPILFIRTKIMHWIAIAGYDDSKELFYVYDSRFGEDSRTTSLPLGNHTFSYEELLSHWKGRLGFRYIAIVITSLLPDPN